MNLPLFIARRIYKDADAKGKEMSRPAVLIAMAGIAIGLSVMLLSVAIIIGFKQEIKHKISGFGAHIQLTNLAASKSYDSYPIELSDALIQEIYDSNEVKYAQRYSTKAGMINTSDAFQGMILKGVGEEYDLSFFKAHLLEGEIPCFSDSLSSGKVLLSKGLADKMKFKVGDKIDTYYLEDNVRARRLQVAGIYQTNFAEYDNLFLITDIYTVNRLNGWKGNQVGGLEIMLKDYGRLEDVTFDLADKLYGRVDASGNRFCVRHVEQLNPLMFAWLEVLDVNIWVILVLMIGVSGFTMIAGLLIIIIERTSMIGVLKSLGANNNTVRRLFLWFAVFLIGRGMLWGNVIGLSVYFLQRVFGVFKLDPAYYYMDTVPMALNWWAFLLLNVGTMFASVLMLLGPSYLITRIHPANSMRYE